MYSLKAIAWNNDRRKFVSPSHTDYEWNLGINWGICSKCLPNGSIGLDCTCGIYHAPNPEALEEYEQYPTSIIALVKMYGVYDIWSGPADLSWTFPTRSDGIRIAGILGNGSLKAAGFLEGTRGVTEMLALSMFNVRLWDWREARKIIRYRWIEYFQIDPYEGAMAK